ncbi:3-oxoacyl-ACP reductase [Paenibacillus baekrokdamisoli]|uniref:3-oxoacyl-ACP reductase n=1 Tax=Paenibacillus baekrokdamisoli TaxID=1712516 RepID=A0A3G9ISV7_9BACL|nr:SDR family NAD(P)-dependent oxidoreductase [Paenibacillus baekrokdamisoli]MBB3071571.1 NAD(P)-dependent dehydrogenase (short-subunit alcohol dehydrogenase family) [Paenibacillus baekrokdamisoli]BBH21917.1 3-oxoacyl-ACP reductase [Paenibacillus baekrokdamisoli]
MRLVGKRVIVTGGAQGIGQGIVDRFLREGARIAVIDMNESALRAASEQWSNEGHEILAFACDLRDKSGLTETVDRIFALWGAVDILVNNAGIAVRQSFLDISDDNWERVMDVNLGAMFRLTKQVAGKMVAQGIKGSIVNMSSKNGLSGSSKLAHYNASKGGGVLLTQSMAVELAPYGIRVNAVAPGFIDTPMDHELRKQDPTIPTITSKTPMGRLGTIEEAANVFLFLASDESSYVTGTTLIVDGGHLANASEP